MNAVTLSHIFSFAEASDRLSYRLVSHQWHSVDAAAIAYWVEKAGHEASEKPSKIFELVKRVAGGAGMIGLGYYGGLGSFVCLRALWTFLLFNPFGQGYLVGDAVLNHGQASTSITTALTAMARNSALFLCAGTAAVICAPINAIIGETRNPEGLRRLAEKACTMPQLTEAEWDEKIGKEWCLVEYNARDDDVVGGGPLLLKHGTIEDIDD